jgi:hypothetical protein
MARMRHHIKRPLLEECLDILRARFPEAHLELSEDQVGRYKHCFTIDAGLNSEARFDLLDCLNWLRYEYGNVGFMFGPNPHAE